jgi:RNA polymerase sigma-70 factor, ECF subfamily
MERPIRSVTAMSLASTVTTGEPTDRTLLQGVREGDERAFEALFLRHYAGVYAVILRLTGDPGEAEEIAQDAFLKLYQRPLADSDESNLRGWLYRVATNAAFNAVRSRRRRRGWLQRIAGRREIGVEGHGDPAELAAERDEARRVREHLARLPERQRNALVLRSSGLSYAEVAAAIGVSPASVGTILARAERAFRASYGDGLGADEGRAR